MVLQREGVDGGREGGKVLQMEGRREGGGGREGREGGEREGGWEGWMEGGREGGWMEGGREEGIIILANTEHYNDCVM